MKLNIIELFTANSLLYSIVLFFAIWDTLQFDKPSIPLSMTIYYSSLFVLFCKKWDCLTKHLGNTNNLIGIILLGVVLLIMNYQYAPRVWTFFRVFLVALVLEQALESDLKLSKILFLLFVILNCFIMFYERKTMTVIFWNSEEYFLNRNDISDLTMFRSSGLTGHPVLGGFLLSIELAFIQMSKIKQSYKYILTVLLFFALLCVNSRTNIGISALISIYLFKDAILSKKNRFIKIAIIVVLFYFFYDLIINTDFGGRLLNLEYGTNDSSTMARFEIFSFLDYIDWKQLIWGNFETVDSLMTVMGLNGIENGYIVLLLKYGLLLGSILIIALTIYQWKALAVYPKDQRIILFLMFILIAFTNPHIGHNIPWIFWVVSYYLFRPSIKNITHDYKNIKTN